MAPTWFTPSHCPEFLLSVKRGAGGRGHQGGLVTQGLQRSPAGVLAECASLETCLGPGLGTCRPGATGKGGPETVPCGPGSLAVGAAHPARLHPDTRKAGAGGADALRARPLLPPRVLAVPRQQGEATPGPRALGTPRSGRVTRTKVAEVTGNDVNTSPLSALV